MSKTLIVSGSPRINGNTMKMVRILTDNLKSIDGAMEFECIHLINQDLQYCRGCMACLKKGGGACPLKDDASAILAAMHRADGIIFAMPGYSHMVSGLYKNFIDRFMYLDHIPEFVGKPAVVISTSGGDGVMGAPKYASDKSAVWWGCTVTDVIGIAHAFFTVNEKYRKKTLEKLSDAANRFYAEINRGSVRKPTFYQYLCFLLNKTELEITPSAMPYRIKVWEDKGWMHMDYYFETSVNPVYKGVGFLLTGAMKLVFKMMLGKNGNQVMAEYIKNN